MGRKSRQKRDRTWDTTEQTPEEAERMKAYLRAIAWKEPKGMCATCAFRPGTEASRNSVNLLSIEACMAGIYKTFNCHAGGIQNDKGFVIPGTMHTGECRGYAALKEVLEQMKLDRLISPT